MLKWRNILSIGILNQTYNGMILPKFNTASLQNWMDILPATLTIYADT